MSKISLNYKIAKFNKKVDNNKYSGIKDNKTDYTNFNDFTFKEKKMKSTRNYNNNVLNRNISYENNDKNNKIKETKKEENKNSLFY